MGKFWQTESFWLTLGSAVAAVLTSAGLGSFAVPVKAAIDAGALIVAAAYVHGVGSTRARSPKPTTTAAKAVGEAVGEVLTDAANNLRGGK